MGMWAHPRSHAPHLRLRHVATHWPWPKQLCGAEDVWSYCSLGVALDWALQQSCWLGRRRLAASGTRLILTPDCWDTKKDWEQRPHGSHGRRSCSGFWNGQNEILGFECSCRLKIKYVWLATYHLQLAKHLNQLRVQKRDINMPEVHSKSKSATLFTPLPALRVGCQLSTVLWHALTIWNASLSHFFLKGQCELWQLQILKSVTARHYWSADLGNCCCQFSTSQYWSIRSRNDPTPHRRTFSRHSRDVRSSPPGTWCHPRLPPLLHRSPCRVLPSHLCDHQDSTTSSHPCKCHPGNSPPRVRKMPCFGSCTSPIPLCSLGLRHTFPWEGW